MKKYCYWIVVAIGLCRCITATKSIQTPATNHNIILDPSNHNTTANTENSNVYALRWASSGGGWRSMICNMGYAHLFTKVGLFVILDETENKNDSLQQNHSRNRKYSNFTAISSNSGGTWFTTQLFYSLPFYNHVITKNTTTTYNFILQWFQSYQQFIESIVEQRLSFYDQMIGALFCRSISPLDQVILLDDISTLCTVLQYFKYSYANFVEGMLCHVATDYNDPTFCHRIMNASNMIHTLQQTDLYIQISLAINSRYTVVPPTSANESSRNLDGTAYIGPNTNITTDDSVIVYAIPIATQYVVSHITQTPYFQYAVEDKDLPLQSFSTSSNSSSNSDLFQLKDYEAYHLYTPDYATMNTGTSKVYTTLWNSTNVSLTRTTLSVPFHTIPNSSSTTNDNSTMSTPNIVQIASSSSANLALVSSSIPSVLAQYFSVRQYSIGKSNTTNTNPTFIQRLSNILRNGISKYIVNPILSNIVYRTTKLTSDFAICTQWPYSTCSAQDTRFLDGGYTDGPSLAGNIRQYQVDGDINRTLKVIVTNNNYYTDTNMKLLSYFATTFNQDIVPGDYIWPPSAVDNQLMAHYTPYRSPQIFVDYMDDILFESKFVSVHNSTANSNLSYAIFHQLTTIENVAFHIRGGQKVDILLLQINSNIPTSLFFKSNIIRYSKPLADLALDIMNSTILMNTIQSFLEM